MYNFSKRLIQKIKIKPVCFALFILLILSFSSYAQDKNINKNVAIGFQLGQYQEDFGLGFNLTSPYFIDDRLALRLRFNNMWNEHLDKSNNTTWTPYLNVSFGIVSIAGEINDFMRLYSEGGILVLFPPDKISSENFEIGGYGLFGFEFYMSPYTNYFIEMGGAGTGAKADKIIGKPIYSNGFIINTGFRVQF